VNAVALALEHVNEHIEGPLPITVTDIQRPGLALTGFMKASSTSVSRSSGRARSSS